MFGGFKSGFLTNKRLDKKDGSDGSDSDDDKATPTMTTTTNSSNNSSNSRQNLKMRDRCKFIPLRLKYSERKLLRLVEAALSVNDYTTKVDNLEFLQSEEKKALRVHEQLKCISGLLSSLVTGLDYQGGQNVVENRDFSKYQELFASLFEIARRYKIMNPEKMRSEYGKLIYILQDTLSEEISEELGCNVVKPIKTVYSELESQNLLHVLDDKDIEIATAAIQDDKTKTREELQSLSKKKYKAVDAIGRRYGNREYGEEEIKQCLHSISDNNSFLAGSRDVIDQMITLLEKNFTPKNFDPKYSLAINEGVNESRLSHSHERQYHYILQSLTLWKDVNDEMYRLWIFAEADLLNKENPYTLKDTGQGFQRVQKSPKTYEAMEIILKKIQSSLTEWVGSSVIHMGDHNVPNALMFIDKYAQVPRILGPIITTLKHLDKMDSNENTMHYLNSAFNGIENARKVILTDFFRSAFDGSGADNFFDAGSCIDGRLTSAWNWCSKLHAKDYLPIFRLAGFNGFDGTDGFDNSLSKK